MKIRTIIYFTILVFFGTSGIAQERSPVAVSPGSESRVAVVGQSCPTFSWTGVEWAEAYRVAVFEAVSAEALPYEEMKAMASPVLSNEIQGRALSWTPSSDERLSNGGVYVWYVQATDAYGKVMWSAGKVFKVEVEARLVGMEDMVRESLKEHGVSNEVIDDVLRDMESGVKEVVVWGVDTGANKSKTQDKIGIQGWEGALNTFYGLNAGLSIAADGYYNGFFGSSAGKNTTSGDGNNFIGYYAGYNNSTGNYNNFIGMNAGYSNTTGHSNTFMGHYAGDANTTGYRNIFIGYHAGRFNTTGASNIFIGYRAGSANTTAYYNTFIGIDAGRSSSTGLSNTFIGHSAGSANTSANANTFIGTYAGSSNTLGYNNSFIGYYAGYSNTYGYNNTFIGIHAGSSNTSGHSNTLIGYFAGETNTTGQGNIFLGYHAGYNETGSNRLYIDNSSTSSPLIYGEFDNDILAINGKLGVGTHSPGYPMHLSTSGTNAAFVADRSGGATNYINATSGYGNFGTVNDYPLRLVVNGLWKMRLDSDQSLTMANGATCTSGGVWTDASSRELKENIHNLTAEEAIDALNDLNPVKYNYKTDKEEGCVGFIAEEVPDLVASKDRKGMSPMDVVAVLTKVVQEQQVMVKKHQKIVLEQKKTTEEQQKIIDELQKEIEELKKKYK